VKFVFWSAKRARWRDFFCSAASTVAAERLEDFAASFEAVGQRSKVRSRVPVLMGVKKLSREVASGSNLGQPQPNLQRWCRTATCGLR
jgi:hypothetical protein